MDARKRGRGEAGAVNANGGFKKHKQGYFFSFFCSFLFFEIFSCGLLFI